MKLTIKSSDFLLAIFITFFGLAFANAQITVTPVPVSQIIGTSYVTYSTSTNSSSNEVITSENSVLANTTSSCNNFNTLLSFGNRGNKVLELQKFLNITQKSNIPQTGYYGKITKNAVINFQIKNNLTPTGNLNPETLTALNKLECSHTTQLILLNNIKSTSVSKKNYFQNKVVKPVNVRKAVCYDKAGNVVNNINNKPLKINYGTNKNITNLNINKMVNEENKAMENTLNIATTTEMVVKESIFMKIKNFFNNFWYNYKANFTK